MFFINFILVVLIIFNSNQFLFLSQRRDSRNVRSKPIQQPGHGRISQFRCTLIFWLRMPHGKRKNYQSKFSSMHNSRYNKCIYISSANWLPIVEQTQKNRSFRPTPQKVYSPKTHHLSWGYMFGEEGDPKITSGRIKRNSVFKKQRACCETHKTSQQHKLLLQAIHII